MIQTYDVVNKSQLVCNPTFGKPSPDSLPLRDDEASTDRPLMTTFVDSPVKGLQSSDEGEVKGQITGEGKIFCEILFLSFFDNVLIV